MHQGVHHWHRSGDRACPGRPGLRLLLVAAAFVSSSACSQSAPESNAGTGGQAVAWFDGMLVGSAQKKESESWADWLDRPWASDAGTPLSVHVQDLGGAIDPDIVAEATVSTCTQLFDADLRGLSPSEARDRAPYSALRVSCYSARLVSQGGAAERSFVADFTMDESSFRQLPPELVTIISPGRQLDQVGTIIEEGGRLGEVIDYTMSAPAFDGSNGPYRISTTTSGDVGWVQDWTWLARGDFDRDGVEDLLVASRLHVPGKQGVDDHRLFVVTRRSADTPMEVTREIPLYPGDETGLCGELAPRCARDI